MHQFAIENTKDITSKIIKCKDIISRLFIEYFSDGGYIDFHVKIATKHKKK